MDSGLRIGRLHAILLLFVERPQYGRLRVTVQTMKGMVETKIGTEITTGTNPEYLETNRGLIFHHAIEGGTENRSERGTGLETGKGAEIMTGKEVEAVGVGMTRTETTAAGTLGIGMWIEAEMKGAEEVAGKEDQTGKMTIQGTGGGTEVRTGIEARREREKDGMTIQTESNVAAVPGVPVEVWIVRTVIDQEVLEKAHQHQVI